MSRNGTPPTALAQLADDPMWRTTSSSEPRLSIWRLAKRLPGLVVSALRLAWAASPADLAGALVLSVTGAVATALALSQSTILFSKVFSAADAIHGLRDATATLALISLLALVRLVSTGFGRWCQARLRPQVTRLAEQRLYELTLSVDVAAFDDPAFCDSMHKARDQGVMSGAEIVDAAIEVLTSTIGLLTILTVLVTLHPSLLVLMIAGTVAAAWLEVTAARMRHATMHLLATRLRRKWILHELMADRRSAAEVRAYAMPRFLLSQFSFVADAEQSEQMLLARRQAVARAAGEAASGVARVLTYGCLGLLYVSGIVSLAETATAVMTIRLGFAAATAMMMSVSRCYEDGLYLTDYLDFCTLGQRYLPPPGGTDLTRSFTTLQLTDVHFTYPASSTPALRGVSMQIRAGEVVALVGENGSGKSTLAKLIAGLYRPASGQACWDGQDTAAISRDALHERITYIPQDFTRWPFSARHNIDAGQPATAATVENAARQAGVHEVIEQLDAGYETLLDRRFTNGQELSGGQWQRLAIARGLHRDGCLLICDEPSAALDARAEHELMRTFQSEVLRQAATPGGGNRSVLMITHRMASARLADRIYVMHHGQIIEHGTHEELLAAQGKYAELYHLQSAAYAAAPAV